MAADRASLLFNAPEAKLFGGPRDHSYPSPEELLHISIVHRGPGIDELVHFYQVVLNMRYVYKFTYPAFEFISISHDDENHRIGFVNVLTESEPTGLDDGYDPAHIPEGTEPRKLPLRPCRIEHTNWRYRDFEAVLLAAKRINQELGIWPRTARHDGGDLTIDYMDPDGNRVELLCQKRTSAEVLFDMYKKGQMTEAEREAEREAMRTGAKVFYTHLDMVKLVALYDSGVPLSDLENLEFCLKMKEAGKL